MIIICLVDNENGSDCRDDREDADEFPERGLVPGLPVTRRGPKFKVRKVPRSCARISPSSSSQQKNIFVYISFFSLNLLNVCCSSACSHPCPCGPLYKMHGNSSRAPRSSRFFLISSHPIVECWSSVGETLPRGTTFCSSTAWTDPEKRLENPLHWWEESWWVISSAYPSLFFLWRVRLWCCVINALLSFLVAYYVAFGPHGPRTPSTPAGETTRLVVGIVSSILIATGMYYAVRASGALFVGINVSYISLMIQSSPSPFLPFCITTLSFNSPPSTKDHVKGVARGHERKGKGTEDEPHPRYVYYEISKSISFIETNHQTLHFSPVSSFFTGITSESYSGKGFVQ